MGNLVVRDGILQDPNPKTIYRFPGVVRNLNAGVLTPAPPGAQKTLTKTERSRFTMEVKTSRDQFFKALKSLVEKSQDFGEKLNEVY